MNNSLRLTVITLLLTKCHSLHIRGVLAKVPNVAQAARRAQPWGSFCGLLS
jgi:hypothetical protein